MAICASAQVYNYPSVTPSGHTLYYDIADGEASVAKKNYNYPNYGNTLDGDLIIPDSVEYDGVKYPVSAIGFEAFEYATMRSVQIPNTVRTIVIRAFCACDSLTSLVIPNSVTSIGMQAFAGSFNITSIVLPDSLITIEQGIFENDTSLISVVVPDAVVSVGFGAFSQCYSLRSVTFGISVGSIGGLAFWGCRNLDSLIFKSNVAPWVGENLFPDAPDTLVIDIPCGSYHSYYAAFGSNHTYVVPSVNFSMSVSSLNPDWGTVNVVQDADQQDVRCDSSAVIQAVANYGYHFLQWSDGETNNTRIVQLTSDTTIVAIFEPNRYIIRGVAYDTTMGYVSGNDTVNYLDTVILTAVPKYGYSFLRWNDYTGHSSNPQYITDNPRQVIATENKSFAAFFTLNTYTLTVNVDTSIHGNCTGSGSFLYLTNNTITATANYGYHFTTWSDGNTNNPRTITLTQDTHFVAIFSKNQYTVTGQTNDNVMGVVSGSATVDYLDSVTLTATSNYGYHFLRWSDHNTDNPRTVVATYNIYLTAVFDFNKYTITLSADSSIHGAVSGAGNYNYLSNRTISANPNYGYHFSAWSDGNTNNPRIITLTHDTSFTAFFDRNRYSITALSSDTSKGIAYGSDTAYYLDTMTVIAVANYGYKFYRWEGTLLQGDNLRTGVFYGDTLNISLIGDIVLNAIFLPDTFNLMLSVDTSIHGTVSGAGSYDYLSEHTITATANYGYHFALWDDGNTDNPRTIVLTQDTHIIAMFAKNIYTLDFQSDNSSIGVVDTTSISGEYLDTVLIHATATPHYHFVRWNDNNTDNPRRFVFDDNHTYTAYFAIDTHTVSVQTSDIARGMVEATGTEFIYGTPCTVTATAYSGYTFAGWSNGVMYNPYTFAVLSDVELTAIFVEEGEEVYTVTVESADLTMGTVSGGGQALYGGVVSIRATANDGYRFVRWNDNDTHAVRTVTVTANATYTAYFESTTQGITGVDESNITVYVENGQIKVVGSKEEPVRVFNMMGQQINNNALPTGVYLVKVGNHPARKVVVIR